MAFGVEYRQMRLDVNFSRDVKLNPPQKWAGQHQCEYIQPTLIMVLDDVCYLKIF